MKISSCNWEKKQPTQPGFTYHYENCYTVLDASKLKNSTLGVGGSSYQVVGHF